MIELKMMWLHWIAYGKTFLGRTKEDITLAETLMSKLMGKLDLLGLLNFPKSNGMVQK